MLSLANARSDEELQGWIERMRGHLAREGIEDPVFEYVVEPKVDGLAISLLYEDGLLVRGATRGNGEVGEDVTHNLRTVGSIPLSIEDAPRRVEVRGEIYISLADFEQVNLRARRGRALDVHEPAQLGGGRDPPARPETVGRAAAVDVGLRRRRDRRADARRATGRRSNGCASTASASTRTSRSSAATPR